MASRKREPSLEKNSNGLLGCFSPTQAFKATPTCRVLKGGGVHGG